MSFKIPKFLTEYLHFKFNRKAIVPYVGTEVFKLYDTYDKVKKYLDINNLYYIEINDLDKTCDDEEDSPELQEYLKEDPWKVISIPDEIVFYFKSSDNKLFMMRFSKRYKGKLPNGIFVGMAFDEVKNIDSTLVFDRASHEYVSKNGYKLDECFDKKSNVGKVESIDIYTKDIDFYETALEENPKDFSNTFAVEI